MNEIYQSSAVSCLKLQCIHLLSIFIILVVYTYTFGSIDFIVANNGYGNQREDYEGDRRTWSNEVEWKTAKIKGSSFGGNDAKSLNSSLDSRKNVNYVLEIHKQVSTIFCVCVLHLNISLYF